MEISIVVPVYKVEAFLNRCVDSILAQSFTDFELILVDDGSPDNCGKICDEYAEKDKRIKVIHQENSGVSAARNAGIDTARGEWLVFIDSDDWVHPDYLRILHNTAMEQDADLVACRYETVYDGTEVDDSPISPMPSADTVEEYWVGDRTGASSPWCKLYRRILFNELRFPVGKLEEDEFVTYKVLFCCNKIAVVDNAMYYYFVNKDGLSKTNHIRRLPDALEAFSRHLEFFENSPWRKAYRLEVEVYAATLSDAIWILKKNKDEQSAVKTEELRAQLKAFLGSYKSFIPFEKRKDIYISAYPGHEWFIRGFGFIKQKLKNER